MQIILTQDVQGLGAAGEKVKTKDGYARNFLLPRGLAVPATRGAGAASVAAQTAKLRTLQLHKAKAEDLANRLSHADCRIAMQVGAQDKLHGAVTAQQIAEKLLAQGITLERHRITLGRPITQLGEFQVPIKLHPQVKASLLVKVVRA